MTKHTWQQIYLAGGQLNRYPYDFIVSSFFHHRPVPTPRVLDLGCGGGNHALFCAENGAEVLAVDYSPAALKVVNERAAQHGLESRIRTCQADFENFHLPESGFDVVIDRLAVSHVAMPCAKQVYEKVYEAMNPNGVVLGCLFTTGHSHKNYGEYDSQQKLWHSFRGGIFEPLKTACFYTETEIRHLFHQFHLLSLSCCSERNMLAPDEQLQSWQIIAEKRI